MIDLLKEPCLVLIWKNRGGEWECLYRLLIPLGKYDVRGKLLRFRLGGTMVRPGDPYWTPDKFGKLSTPFRDGAHIRWDSELLGLPKYVVWGKKIEVVPEREE